MVAKKQAKTATTKRDQKFVSRGDFKPFVIITFGGGLNETYWMKFYTDLGYTVEHKGHYAVGIKN